MCIICLVFIHFVEEDGDEGSGLSKRSSYRGSVTVDTKVGTEDVLAEKSMSVRRKYSGVDYDNISYKDFNVHSREYGTFRLQDYSWEDHGYTFLDKYYEGIASLLTTQFTTIRELTYHEYGPDKDVDTTPYRNAIWHYVHRLFGILHDDYEYAEVRYQNKTDNAM